MLRLYIFPKDLKIYYDGNVITNSDLIIMAVISLTFGLVILYVWLVRKNFKLTGLLLLLPVLLAPSFSPIKVTWNMAERYLYLGTIFYAVLMAIIILELARRFKWKYLWLVLSSLLIIGLATRTVLRNHDYLDNKQFARITIQAAPNSVRPYNDLGTLYYMDGEVDIALDYYRQALAINKLSATAINNVGLIFIRNGIPDYIWEQNYFTQMDPDDYQSWMARGVGAVQNEKVTNAAFYIVGAIHRNRQGTDALNLMGDIYYAHEKWEDAKNLYLQSIDVNSNQAKIYFKLSVIEGLKLGNYDKAKEYTRLILELDPTNAEAKKNLEVLENKPIIID